MNDFIHVVPGDTLTLTIKGKVTDPTKANTSDAATLRIYRPTKSFPWAARGRPAIRVDAVFEPDAEVTFNVESRFKNGVHIDEAGRYWMRRPDGWHEMSVTSSAVPSIPGTEFAPRGIQRLKEDKG